jgi:hypothetical protein
MAQHFENQWACVAVRQCRIKKSEQEREHKESARGKKKHIYTQFEAIVANDHMRD